MGAFAAATAVYSLQTLVPTWPAVPRYWFFVTDLPSMDYTAIALSILFRPSEPPRWPAVRSLPRMGKSFTSDSHKEASDDYRPVTSHNTVRPLA